MDICVKPSTLSGEINAISSKSDVIRFLIAAALARGTSSVHFTTLSDDIKAAVCALETLGARIDLSENEGGFTAKIRPVTRVPENITINAAECGTVARMILPIAAALCGSFTLTGKNGLLKRPFKDLCDCLERNGTNCSDSFLPITAQGKLKSGIFEIRGDKSSQYISGLLFALPLLDGDSEIRLTTPLVSAGYVDMTLATLKMFGIKAEKTDFGYRVKGNQTFAAVSDYRAEGDWSNAAFWICAGIIGGDITVHGLDTDSYQRDKDILMSLTKPLRAMEIDGKNTPDILPVLATVFALAKGESVITGGAHLKIKESDRIATTVAMLKALGADIKGTDDGFIIKGVKSFNGGEVDAANDHRIAMSAAIASTRALGDIIIRGADCVSKSYPSFWDDFEKLGGRYCVING